MLALTVSLGSTPAQRAAQLTVTAVLMAGPFVTGFGVTAGFHRCLTHRSFSARPALRIGLAIAASMSFQGEVSAWVVHPRVRARRLGHACPLA
jgi:fatty-acid desaturase